MNRFRNSGNSTPSDAELARFDEDFANAPAEDRSHGSVPDGKYRVNVQRAELTKARSSGNAMLKWTLQIIGPTHAGRLLWRNNVMATRENIAWLKSDLHTCGLVLQKLSDLPANIEKLLDVKLEVTKRTKGENENVYFNRRIVDDDDGGDGEDGGGTEVDPWGGRTDEIPF